MREVLNKIRNLFGVGHIQFLDDRGPQQTVQLEIGAGGPDELREVIDKLVRLTQYGFASAPPIGAEAVAIFLGGNRSSGVVIATGDRATRYADLIAYEAVLYNGEQQTFFKMAADGKAHLNCDLVVGGKITATGDIEDHVSDGKGATMEAMRQTYDGHTHPAGSPNTSVPNQQMPD